MEGQGLRDALGAAVSDAPTPLAAADRLCVACVEHLDVDGASISLIHNLRMPGTFGSSSPLSRTLDELQFTHGEGPCLEAVASGRAVLAPELDSADERRWPALTETFIRHGVQAIFALPVAVGGTPIGVLDLFRHRSGSLDDEAMAGGEWAAGLAALPLLDLMNSDTDWHAASAGQGSWEQLESLERVEVYQATGMIISSLDATPAEALVLLRAHAVSRGLTATEVARHILGGRLVLRPDAWHDTASGEGST